MQSLEEFPKKKTELPFNRNELYAIALDAIDTYVAYFELDERQTKRARQCKIIITDVRHSSEARAHVLALEFAKRDVSVRIRAFLDTFPKREAWHYIFGYSTLEYYRQVKAQHLPTFQEKANALAASTLPGGTIVIVEDRPDWPADQKEFEAMCIAIMRHEMLHVLAQEKSTARGFIETEHRPLDEAVTELLRIGASKKAEVDNPEYFKELAEHLTNPEVTNFFYKEYVLTLLDLLIHCNERGARITLKVLADYYFQNRTIWDIHRTLLDNLYHYADRAANDDFLTRMREHQ